MSTATKTDRLDDRAALASPGKAALALVAGWVLPGCGHIVLGRAGRGLVFATLVLGSFGLGLAHDGRLALRNEREPFLSSLQILANVGVGPADAIARLKVYGEPAYTLPSGLDSPVTETRLQTLRDRSRSPLSAYGTAYLWTAGLMNLLLLFDVWDIARGRKS